MIEYVIGGAVALAIVLVLWLGFAWSSSGGTMGRYFASRRLANRWLKDPAYAAKVDDLDAPPPPPKPVKPSGEPLRLLALLQREGRLLDFLLEDISAYANDQVGAAVRDIHQKCKKAIQDHLDLEPVLSQAEGATVDVPAGFDPSAIRLTGNVTGEPPFRGALQHHGWRVANIKLAKPPEGQDEFVLHPAEVELS